MKFLTEEDLQEILQISEKQAKALIRTEGFPCVKIGRSYRVEENEFLKWMMENREIKLNYSKC